MLILDIFIVFQFILRLMRSFTYIRILIMIFIIKSEISCIFIIKVFVLIERF